MKVNILLLLGLLFQIHPSFAVEGQEEMETKKPGEVHTYTCESHLATGADPSEIEPPTLPEKERTKNSNTTKQ